MDKIAFYQDLSERSLRRMLGLTKSTIVKTNRVEAFHERKEEREKKKKSVKDQYRMAILQNVLQDLAKKKHR